MDCVRNIKINPNICPEKCDGTIVEMSRHYSYDAVNSEILQEIFDEYEHYKNPESINNIPYNPYYSFRKNPKVVVISLKSTMFHRIHKVGMRL